MDIFLIISLILGITAVIITIVIVSISATNFTKYDAYMEQDLRESKINKRMIEVLQGKVMNLPAGNIARGPQGVRGPQGPMGPPGGYYTASGPLINMSNGKVGTPTFGKGEPSILYLDEKRYSPIQYWYLENQDGGKIRVRNKFTDMCLTANQLGDAYSDVCTANNNNQLFTWGPSMQLMSSGFNNKCVSVAPFQRDSTTNTSYDYATLQAKQNSNVGNVDKLKLETCSTSLNPKQTWYIGN